MRILIKGLTIMFGYSMEITYNIANAFINFRNSMIEDVICVNKMKTKQYILELIKIFTLHKLLNKIKCINIHLKLFGNLCNIDLIEK